MTPLYHAADPLEAEILKNYLALHGIRVEVFGSLAWGGRGDLPADLYPRLLLPDARDEPRARELLRDYERNAHNPSQWRCACGEWVPGTFDSCWACTAPRGA